VEEELIGRCVNLVFFAKINGSKRDVTRSAVIIIPFIPENVNALHGDMANVVTV
jgi:hypothetical protein